MTSLFFHGGSTVKKKRCHHALLVMGIEPVCTNSSPRPPVYSVDAREVPQHQNGERPCTVRNYTIVGNYKVGFPQWRVMKCQYPGEEHVASQFGPSIHVPGK